MSRFARTAVAASMIALGALVVPVPAPAQATSALLGPVIASLPGYASSGGVGTVALNTAVSRACNSGKALTAQEWFTLPAGDLGLIYARAQGLGYLGRGAAEEFPGMRVALVDYKSGAILSCTGGPLTVTTAHPRRQSCGAPRRSSATIS